MSSLYIVIPAYNEAENIGRTIDQWYPVVERHNDEGKSRLVIINDGSKDNTYELLQKCAATRPLLVPIDKPNGGHGPTVLYGYRYAIQQKADYIFQTDSDGQTNPDEFEPFWNQRGCYDAIIGTRSRRRQVSKVRRKRSMFPSQNYFRREGFRRQCAIPPDEERTGSQIHRQASRRFQHPKHYVHYLLCSLQRKSKIHRHHLQTPTRWNQFHQREENCKNRLEGSKRFL